MNQDILIPTNKKYPYAYELNIFQEPLQEFLLSSEEDYKHYTLNPQVVHTLEEILKTKRIGIIALGKTIDVYHPMFHAEFLISRILKVLIKYRQPIVIYTKTNYILNDLNYIKELSTLTYVGLNMNVMCSHLEHEKIIDQMGNSFLSRFECIDTIKKNTDVVVGITINPVIPYLLDSKENLELIFQHAVKYRADYLEVMLLKVNKENASTILSFVEEKYPEHFDAMYRLLLRKSIPTQYKVSFVEMIKELYNKFSINQDHRQLIKERILGINRLDL